MDAEPECVKLLTPLAEAARTVYEHDFVLVLDEDRSITGIVTVTDLARQFKQLAEPFVLIGEIELRLRNLLRGKFEPAEFVDAAGGDEDARGPDKLTFGGIERMLQREDTWAALDLGVDHTVFLERIASIWRIRNDVMHFAPEPLPGLALVRRGGTRVGLGASGRARRWCREVVVDRLVRRADPGAELAREPGGHLTNLSTVPAPDGHVHAVPLFPSASDRLGRQGFVRVINDGDADAEVGIVAFDETRRTYEPLKLTVGAGRAAHFNSDDLELGNPGKGLAGSTGAGTGDWRLGVSFTCRLTPSRDGDMWSIRTSSPGRSARTTSGCMLAGTMVTGARPRVVVPGFGETATDAFRAEVPDGIPCSTDDIVPCYQDFTRRGSQGNPTCATRRISARCRTPAPHQFSFRSPPVADAVGANCSAVDTFCGRIRCSS